MLAIQYFMKDRKRALPLKAMKRKGNEEMQATEEENLRKKYVYRT
jgi:hypothetical protein